MSTGPKPAASLHHFAVSPDQCETPTIDAVITPITRQDKSERRRDPRTGRLLPRHCQLCLPGHQIHPMPANRSAGQLHRSGKLVAVEGSVITVDFDDETKQYRNCDPDRLIEITGMGRNVQVCERYRILRARYGYLFSIADAQDPWAPCDLSPLTSVLPDALAERFQSHGGFLVPGQEILRRLGEESDR